MTKYVCSREVREILGGLTRQRINAIAHDNEWRFKDYNRPYWYNLDDVKEYMHNKDHTQRAKKKYNWTVKGLIRHDENGFSSQCPVCRDDSLTTQ